MSSQSGTVFLYQCLHPVVSNWAYPLKRPSPEFHCSRGLSSLKDSASFPSSLMRARVGQSGSWAHGLKRTFFRWKQSHGVHGVNGEIILFYTNHTKLYKIQTRPAALNSQTNTYSRVNICQHTRYRLFVVLRWLLCQSHAFTHHLSAWLVWISFVPNLNISLALNHTESQNVWFQKMVSKITPKIGFKIEFLKPLLIL